MKCNVCGNDTFHNRQVEEVFYIEGHLVMVEGIPARIFDRCGVPAEHARRLRRRAVIWPGRDRYSLDI